MKITEMKMSLKILDAIVARVLIELLFQISLFSIHLCAFFGRGHCLRLIGVFICWIRS